MGGWEGAYWYEYKSAATRHNNHINIWAISVQISGWTCAVCVPDSVKPIFSWSICLFSEVFILHRKKKKKKKKQQYTASCPNPGQKTTFPFCSHFHSLLCVAAEEAAAAAAAAAGGSVVLKGQSWAAVWGRKKKRKRDRMDKRSLWGVFLTPRTILHTHSPWELTSLSQETPCYSYPVDKTAARSHFLPLNSPEEQKKKFWSFKRQGLK